MDILMTVLLAGGVMCSAYGISQNDLFMSIVGGILLQTYSAIVSSFMDL